MNTEFTITKSKIECVKISGKNGMYANISMDYKGSKGRISIASDFGDWSYFWGSCGCDFKEFLIGLDIHYAAGKMGEDKFFDLDSTISQLKERINDNARSKEHKKELKRELSDLKDSYNKEEFIHKMWSCDKIMEMENHQPDLYYTISPSFKQFWEKLWSVFVIELKTEVSEAATT